MRASHTATSLLILLLAAWPAPCTASQGPRRTLKLATWNMEWLLAPRTLHDLRLRCASTTPTRLPCDVARNQQRSTADFAALARQARRLDADVIALQEVEDIATAARVFRDHEFCLSGRHDLQNLGFAIRRGLPHRCEPDYQPLSLGERSRRGVQLTLFPGTPAETWMLSVHLKSGCSRDPLDAGPAACRTLAGQAAPLAAWIEMQVRARRRYAILGDFNRVLTAESHAGLWPQLAGASPPGQPLVNTAAGEIFSNCHEGQRFSAFIDYILLGGGLSGSLQPKSFRREGYSSLEARRYQLSDHCPVSITLDL